MINGLNIVVLASLENGLIFALLAMGLMISFKILDLADLSVEGTFPLGAFIFSKFVYMGLGAITSTLISFIFGAIGGFITYILYKKFKIESILAGILTMTILYSINLRIMGTSNFALFNYKSIFTSNFHNYKIIILIIIVMISKIILDIFFKTEKGYLLIITGDNESLVKSLGKNPDTYIMLGLMLANGLVALSGCLMAQYQGFADSQMGVSIIVTALASIIIGDTILKNNTKIKNTSRAIIGAIAYRIISGLAIHAGLNPNDLRMVTALIVILFLVYNNFSLRKIDKSKKRWESKNA